MELHSQQVRALAPESDPLKIGMGWTIDDLSKPQIMVESTFGDSHPGSAHLDQFVRQAVQAVNEHGGKAARYFATDLCDGIAQGHDGINYSLAHREAIVDLVEAQANASGFDGGIFIASCDKAVPAMLMSIGRLKEMSAIVVTGGVMEAHPLPEEYTVQDPACAINELLTLEQIGKFDAWEKTGVISSQQLRYYKHNACPSCGACSFMGTASTMQIMAEALGLMLPGTALMPATAPELKKAAYDAGVQLLKLLEQGIRAQDIVAKESFENAIMVHAAISGSTNATMHLPAIAHEFGIEIDADTFDRMHRGAHYLLNIRPSGDWPAQYFYYAGGVPRVMEEIRSMLHLDAMTVTGKTLGENLDALKKSGFYEHCDELLREKTAHLSRRPLRTDIIRTFENAKGTDGSIAILKGNLAPEGCVIKHTACPKEMFQVTLRAKPYDSEEACIAAVLHGDVRPGDAVFIRYEGPRGSGMPEMFYTGEAICADPALASSVALITDGRFSGGTSGLSVGYISPEAALGGALALVRDGDTIQIGLGNLSNAAADAMCGKYDLGIHTEILCSATGRLMAKGVVNNSRKNFHPGKTVCSFVWGDQDFYDFIDRNPDIELMPSSYVNDPYIIAQNHNMVSINTAVQIDLTGQICSESLGSRQYSGTGGATDFAAGAYMSPGGRGIVVITSTAKNGTVSKIQPILSPGSVVSISRNWVDCIVTEYGVAHLRGTTIRQRVERLIAIAHPDFRGELRRQADKLMLW